MKTGNQEPGSHLNSDVVVRPRIARSHVQGAGSCGGVRTSVVDEGAHGLRGEPAAHRQTCAGQECFRACKHVLWPRRAAGTPPAWGSGRSPGNRHSQLSPGCREAGWQPRKDAVMSSKHKERPRGRSTVAPECRITKSSRSCLPALGCTAQNRPFGRLSQGPGVEGVQVTQPPPVRDTASTPRSSQFYVTMQQTFLCTQSFP